MENLIKNIDEYKKTNGSFKSNDFIFKDLAKNDGFIVYSKESVDDYIKNKDKNLNAYFQNDKNNNRIEKNIYRYYYYKKLNSDANNTATIIMLNPAFADSEEADATIDNIQTYLSNIETGFKSFEIINLCPIRLPDSKLLSKANRCFIGGLNEQKEYYDKYFKKFVINFLANKKQDQNNIIIAAWGANDRFNRMAKNYLKSEGLKLKCYAKNINSPCHFGSQIYNKQKNKNKNELKVFEFKD